MHRLKFRINLLALIFVLINLSLQGQDAADIDLVCPDHININCETELQPLSEYGHAMYRIGEEMNDLEDQQSKKNIDDCGKGHIERIWRYKSDEGDEYNCSQFIYIGEDENGLALIDWPKKEVVLSWCEPSYTPNDLPEGSRRPRYFEGECNKMEHTYSDEIIYLSESCKEVHRNWVVHDWCYDSKNIPGNDGHYKYTQVIKFEIPDDIDYLLLKDIEVVAEDCEKARVVIPDVKAGIQDCNRRLKITNDSPFADSKGKNASGTYPVGETVVNFNMELECTKDKAFALRIIVKDPCREKAIIEEKELAVKMQRSFVRPNPFITDTEIILTNEITQKGSLSLYKTNGDLISERTIKFTQGTQRVSIGMDELSMPGVYYYAILVGERKLEGRLIKIR